MTQFAVSFWGGALWTLALLGLVLLPLNYRGGGDVSHGHSLLQLWADAADGTIDHHHHPTHAAPLAGLDWLAPEVSIESAASADIQQPHPPDVGDHEDSLPMPGTIPFLVASLAVVRAPRTPLAAPERRANLPAGRAPAVPIPPPRPVGLAA